MSLNKSIAAYQDHERVASYDQGMEIMHPNRRRMVEIMLDVLSASGREPGLVLDIGTGTGYLLDQLLDRFPAARAVAVDGSPAMMTLARARLGRFADRVDFRVFDFRSLAEACADVGTVDAVVSTFALHHLAAIDKASLARAAFGLLAPGGYFLSGDLIVCEDDDVEDLVQRMRVRGIVARAGGDPRFCDEVTTRATLSRIEREDNDQPQKLEADIAGLKAAGFGHISVFWRETREVVLGGVKGADQPKQTD